jgi:hypothetical protein
MKNLKRISFGGTAAIVTNMALIIGLQTAAANKVSILTSLLVIAIADNLSDSLSIHVYQESEHLESRAAFFVTVSNFFARFGVSLTFILLVLALPLSMVPMACTFWGLFLLGTLTYFLARERKVGVASEVFKHIAAAFGVILAAKIIGVSILNHSQVP